MLLSPAQISTLLGGCDITSITAQFSKISRVSVSNEMRMRVIEFLFNQGMKAKHESGALLT